MCDEGLVLAETSVKNNINIQMAAEVDPALLKMLDRGIDDVMSGRVIPHKNAMKEIEKIRDQRKASLKKQTTVVSCSYTFRSWIIKDLCSI